LQGFPESFVIDEESTSRNRFYRQIGNAVCPPVVAAICGSVLDAFMEEMEDGASPTTRYPTLAPEALDLVYQSCSNPDAATTIPLVVSCPCVRGGSFKENHVGGAAGASEGPSLRQQGDQLLRGIVEPVPFF
jgi:hypothetical protein